MRRFEGRAWSIYQGDALLSMARLDPSSADVVLIDPPYCAGGFQEQIRKTSRGMLRSVESGWFVSDDMGTAGLCWLLREYAIQAARVLKPGGHFLVFCDWRMAFVLFPALGIRPGDEVVVLVRPERIDLRFEEITTPPPNSFGGHVEQDRFLGSVRRLDFAVPGGLVRVETRYRDAPKAVVIPPDAVRLLPPDD